MPDNFLNNLPRYILIVIIYAMTLGAALLLFHWTQSFWSLLVLVFSPGIKIKTLQNKNKVSEKQLAKGIKYCIDSQVPILGRNIGSIEGDEIEDAKFLFYLIKKHKF